MTETTTTTIHLTLHVDPEALGGSNAPASSAEIRRYQEILHDEILGLYPQAGVLFVTSGREEYLVDGEHDDGLRDQIHELEEAAVEGRLGEWQDSLA